MTLHEQLQQIFREVFGDETLVLTDETTSRDVPGWDSVAHLNLMFTIEQSFDIQFKGNELANFGNIGELKRFLMDKGR